MNHPNQGIAREEQLDRDAAAEKQFKSIWTIALQEYKEKTGHDMMNEKTIRNASDLSNAMELKEKSFEKQRRGKPAWQTTRKVLKECVVPLQGLSSVAAGVIGLTPFAPAGVIFSAGVFLINACNDVTKAYELVEELISTLR